MRNLMTKHTITILTLFFIGCSEQPTKEEDNQREKQSVDVQLDQATKMRMIDKWNNATYIYAGTKTYDSILAKYPALPFKVINRAEWYGLKDEEKKKLKWNMQHDTIFFTKTKDTLKINHWFPSAGYCWHYYPFIYEHSDTLEVFIPEKTEGDIQIEGGDTVETGSACSQETLAELIISIPLNNKLKNKTILYKSKTYKIK